MKAEEIWEYIEQHHDSTRNKVANTYAMTLDNGITYFYTMSDGRRLINIYYWFEGYYAYYGTKETGFPYIVKVEKNQKLLLYKIIDKTIDEKPFAIIKKSVVNRVFYGDTSVYNEIHDIDIQQEKMSRNIPYIKMVYEYIGDLYLVFDVGYNLRCVYSTTKQKDIDIYVQRPELDSISTGETLNFKMYLDCNRSIHYEYDKYNAEYRKQVDTRIVFRVPCKPYRYALVLLYEKVLAYVDLVDMSLIHRIGSANHFKIGMPIDGFYPIYVNIEPKFAGVLKYIESKKVFFINFFTHQQSFHGCFRTKLCSRMYYQPHDDVLFRGIHYPSYEEFEK